MNERTERGLFGAVPFVAMLAVAIGLRLGAPSDIRAALVYASPAVGAGTDIAWQIVALEDKSGARSALASTELNVTVRRGEATARWQGQTNEDGVAEAHWILPRAAGDGVEIEVRDGAALLARGLTTDGAPVARRTAFSAWMPFAQRSGPIVLDVAVLGQRAAPGFAASVWVRATDGTAHSGTARLSGVAVQAESDPSVASATARTRSDAEGWAELDVTPIGLAVTLHLRASASDGRSGDWTGGLFMSPGAAHLETRRRWDPAESPEIAITLPSPRTTAYVEIDDARGRAWATTVATRGAQPEAWLRTLVVAPALAPGLYWAIASNDPAGAAGLGPGTIVRPFFVASSDDAALAFGADPVECGLPLDTREPSRRLASCLAATATASTPRWLALDGFAMTRAREAEKRSRGLAVSLGAVFTAILLEAALIVRGAVRSRGRLREATRESTAGSPAIPNAIGIAIGLLVALLGLMLLAAFLVRAA